MASPNIQTRATLGDLGKRGLGPQFEDVFDQNLVRYSGRDTFEKIVSYIKTEKAVLRTTGLTGYELLTEFEEGAAIPQTSNVKTFETVYTVRDYGKGVTVTHDQTQDREAVGQALDEFAGLTKSADVTFAKGPMMMLNGAFGTTAKVQGFSLHRYNDEALVATSHSRADGGTAQSNRSATNIVLTELNLETVRLQLVKQLTDNGLPIMDMGRIHLVTPDDLEKSAVIFTGSTLRPSTANNDLNFYRGIQMDVISSRWLNSTFGGSATQWFLIADFAGNMKALRVYHRGAPEFRSGYDNLTWNETFNVKHRYAIGNAHWLGVAGSDGTGS